MTRALCAKNWLGKYAPDNFKFKVQDKVPEDLKLNDKQKQALKKVAGVLKEKKLDDKHLHDEFYKIFTELGLKPNEFFEAAYSVLINKKRGPMLASFVLTIGKEKVIKLFEKF